MKRSDLLMTMITILCFLTVLSVLRLNAVRTKDADCGCDTELTEKEETVHYLRAWEDASGYIWYEDTETGLLYKTPTGLISDAIPVTTPDGRHLSHMEWIENTKKGM